jgi:hypothetical protein
VFIRVMTKICIFTNIHSYTTPYISLVMKGYCSEVDKDFALLGYYVTSSGNFLLKFQDNLLVPSSRA